MANANAFLSRCMSAIAIAAWLCLTALSASAIQPHSNDYATQGFLFDWSSPNTVLPTPITAQCETLNVKWNRNAGTGPDPIPPFFLKIYSSAVNSTSDSFQLVPAGNMASTQVTIPFPPGTIYVICMTDSMGVSGGCQDTYTVYPSPTNQTCSGFTPPAQVLGMKAISLATQSTFSRWGWPNSCTDLELEPIEDGNGGTKGSPPYTLTVAPALRPPLNITFEQSVKWTITLAHGAPFFLSVSDCHGLTWTDGPIHAGAGDKSCLLDSTNSQSGLSAPITIGTAIGSFIIGGILAVVVFWLIVRRHRNKRPTYQFDRPYPSPLDNTPPQSETNRPTLAVGGLAEIHSYTPLSNSTENRSGKRFNNYGPLDDSPTPNQRTPDVNSIPLRTTTHRNSLSSVSSPTTVGPPPLTSPINSASNPGAVHEVFVVHHDAGAPPPVTVYALPGSRVTELPPGYDFGSRSSDNTTGPPQPQLALLGEHASPVSSSPSYFGRDQKAAYTPRSPPPPTSTFSPPPGSSSPGRSVTPGRTLPSTPQPQPPTPIIQAHMSDQSRGPRPMSSPDDIEQNLWK